MAIMAAKAKMMKTAKMMDMLKMRKQLIKRRCRLRQVWWVRCAQEERRCGLQVVAGQSTGSRWR
eukprot:4604460-Alexandrium_andersonii.AAC.1